LSYDLLCGASLILPAAGLCGRAAGQFSNVGSARLRYSGPQGREAAGEKRSAPSTGRWSILPAKPVRRGKGADVDLRGHAPGCPHSSPNRLGRKGPIPHRQQSQETSPDDLRMVLAAAIHRAASPGNPVLRSRPQPSASPAAASIETKNLWTGGFIGGRLLDISGRPIAKASIRPMIWNDQNQEENVRINIFFSAEWGKENWPAKRTPTVVFTLRNMPRPRHAHVKFRRKGFGEPHGMLPLERPAR